MKFHVTMSTMATLICLVSNMPTHAVAHTLLHLGLFSTSRTVELYPDHLDINYHSSLVADLDTSISTMIVDSNGDGRLDSHEKDDVSTAAMEYLAMDLTVFLDREQLNVTTTSQSVFPDHKGFDLSMKVKVPIQSADITTQAVTIIDPAYAFPPMDPKQQVPPTAIITHDSEFVDEKDHAQTKGQLPSQSSTVILWHQKSPARPSGNR